MGIVLANKDVPAVKQIIEFKENLRVLMLSSLFIILAARLKAEDVAQVGWESAAFLAVLVFAVRPASVALSALGSELNRQQRLFLCWMAPRGIVAAAVSSIFAARLSAAGYAEASKLVPVMFFVIIGAAVIYGMTGAWVARRLNVAQPAPQGALIVGAHSWARALARALRAEGFRVVLVDSSRENISAARMEGLPAHFEGILSKTVLDEIDLYGIGKLFALTSNDEVNSLAALHFRDIFGRAGVNQLHPQAWEQGGRKLISPKHLSGRFLFGPEVTYECLSKRFTEGATVKTTSLTEKFDYSSFRQRYGETAIPLFLVTESRSLVVYTSENQIRPRPRQKLISLVEPGPQAEDSPPVPKPAPGLD